ncbi:CDP-diacylglycerol--serine O-phosphatidyltransferase [Clostridium sp. YIM B02515]|uniref:CDP-diacylglycerol--serine O-phosphatidyltransferase n=1 Tax=Clostridium rhizosphaerae TaxID=2803861 RepID=A0ABS1TBP5_9CLOT|nr:CDP-diacylglycerol--serine O-phosphatidyltransferase [Clostridium rhizosphaerae]MBL4936781.1 CDP-diacylglycerol--serine O-phosphatidyltransferase [Clostridium rhizosphaerae]
MSKKNAVPNIFTFANLACGVLSLLMTFNSNYRWACLFIIIAGLIDRYDGRVARFLQVSSDIGKELDSLADLVSFGVAPSILMFNLYDYTHLGLIGYMLVLVFPIAGAYRLARYNSMPFNNVFTGIPITIAGTFLALFALLTLNYKTNLSVSIVLVVMLSYLMISKLRFKKV